VVSVLIAGGGTGGHVFPMIAVGEALRAVEPGAEVFYVGTARGIETRAIPAAGGELELVDVAPLRGGGLRGFARGAVQAVRGLAASRRLIERRRPDVVFSVGGYAGGPIALAARLSGVPLAILEPNAVLGLTNRMLSPFASRAYTAFGDLDRRLPEGKGIKTGVPLRRSIEPSAYEPRDGRFDLLVLGGSAGAKALNERVPPAFAALLARMPHARILHQAGRGRGEETRDAYLKSGAREDRWRVVEFIDDVGKELRAADVVVQRCGASSLAELCATGRPSVLVPYPFAADQHQLQNARSLEGEGAAVALEQSEATPEKLASILADLAQDAPRRVLMADAARRAATPGAARAVAEDLLELARRKR
jgi:UDP-N-acetylglucosamine--N-acetylmuramyl-(pentapeptide) pyrophosphoryl-undecaprenol N-acetylglucosamine transferase